MTKIHYVIIALGAAAASASQIALLHPQWALGCGIVAIVGTTFATAFGVVSHSALTVKSEPAAEVKP